MDPLKRIPPAPSSGYSVATSGKSACTMLRRPLFENYLAPSWVFPFTYDRLCEAIEVYNANHDEKAFGMGSENQQRAELAAFLGHTLHSTGDYQYASDLLTCGDSKVVSNVDGEEERYCRPCLLEHFDFSTLTCSQSMIANGESMASYCITNNNDPSDWMHGCECMRNLQEVQSLNGSLAGYFLANQDYFGRGALQLRWNEQYLKASFALTGSSEILCQSPDLVAMNPLYAWGSALYYWMENLVDGKTYHMHALDGSFGGTLQNIDGGTECNISDNNRDGIKLRLNRYCHAAVTLRSTEILSLDGCTGLQDLYFECLGDGTCAACQIFEDLKTDKQPTASPTTSGGSGIPLGSDENNDTNNPPPSLVPSPQSNTASPTKRTPSFLETASPTSQAPRTSSPSTNPTNAPTTVPISSPTTASPSISPIVETPNVAMTKSPTIQPTPPKQCTGEPCNNNGNCRNADGICGEGDFFCNNISIWTMDCVASSSPSLSPITPPHASVSPFMTVSLPTPSPISIIENTTDAPTEEVINVPTASFDSSLSSTQTLSPSLMTITCTGEACMRLQDCRNQFGFCGQGRFFCNGESTWTPECHSSSSSLPSLQTTVTARPTKQISVNTPTKSPVPIWWGVAFGDERPVSNVRNGGVSVVGGMRFGKLSKIGSACGSIFWYFYMLVF